MHDYTARLIHEDRMRQLTREADAARLAAAVRHRQKRPAPLAEIRGWLRTALARWSTSRSMKDPAPLDAILHSAADDRASVEAHK